MPDIKATVINRDLNPYHSFLSSFFAGLAELGMINQGSINIVAKRAADYLYSYLDAKEILPDMGAVPGDTITFKINGIPAHRLGPDASVWTEKGDIIDVDLAANTLLDKYWQDVL